MADEDEEKQRLEMQLEGAVTARLQHFKDQAEYRFLAICLCVYDNACLFIHNVLDFAAAH